MKKQFLYFFILLSTLGYTQTTPPCSTPSGWKLDFYDEFTSLDLTKWRVSNNVVGGSGYYTFMSSNVAIDQGKLALWCTKPNPAVNHYYGAQVSLGASTAEYEGNTYYGYYSARVWIPNGKGWPAFWLAGKNGHMIYKVGGEIDIMEHEQQGTKVTSTIWGTSDWDNLTSQGMRPTPANATLFQNSWHHFGVLYTPTMIQFYYDNVPYGPAYTAFHPREQYSITFSYQVEENVVPDPADIGGPGDNAFMIDYVKYWVPNTPYTENKRWGYAWFDNAKAPDNFDNNYVTNSQDVFVKGRFSNNEKDDLLIVRPLVSSADKVTMMTYKSMPNEYWSVKWQPFYSTSNGSFATGWLLYPTDKILTGNFSTIAPNDEVLLISATQYSNMYYFNSTTNSWVLHFCNGAPQYPTIGDWTISSTDKYLVGDFDGDAADDDELLCVSASGRVAIYNFVYNYSTPRNSWVKIFDNNSTGWIYNSWQLATTDRFFIGNFNSDAKDEIFIVSQTKKQGMFAYSGAGSILPIYVRAPVNGVNYIAGWYMNNDDVYVVGDFNDDLKDEFLIMNEVVGSAGIVRYLSGSTWNSEWYADDHNLYLWYVRQSDKFLVGDFDTYKSYGSTYINTSKDNLLITRGTDSFLYEDICAEQDPQFMCRPYSNNDCRPFYQEFRSALLFSPLSSFFNTQYASMAPMNGYKSASADGMSSIFQGEDKNEVNIYPNPSKDALFTFTAELPTQVEIFNMQGQKVTDFSVEFEKVIDLSHLSKGLYIAVCISSETRSSHKLIIE